MAMGERAETELEMARRVKLGLSGKKRWSARCSSAASVKANWVSTWRRLFGHLFTWRDTTLIG
jgi:hypothetical protein